MNTETARFTFAINTETLRALNLTLNEYAILEFITKKQADPDGGFLGWCIVSKKEIAETFNLTQRSVFSILKVLLKRGLIERHEKTKFIRVSSLYHHGTFFTHYEDSSYSMKNLPKEKESSKEKEILIYTSPSEREGVPKRQPSCPLLNGSPLKEKYPNGHGECIEYYLSEEEDRHQKFINKPKQFQFIHKILRAGYGFDTMDKTIRQVEKKYGKGAWDYGTLASWIEKGAGSG